ncbi:hypothetical protein [Sphaerisporangium fuscum]|uniref:hypothetical protein n=1 Tax=Sphaerisporangium fuscum TaxID=2835868 RepID=UPI002029B138|nr:hypothetical protein [Sphaerisporangium fuscum]
MDLTANPELPGTAGSADPQREAAPAEGDLRDHPAGEGDQAESDEVQQDDGAELRRYADTLVTRLAADGTVPPPPATLDVPGLWLAPAVEALLAILSGDDALDPLARAAQLDETGTALFLCLSLAVSGNGDRVHASWLGTAFGDLATDRPVTPGQRALWTAAARGAYGPAGKIFVLRKLDAAAVPSTAEPDRWLGVLVTDDEQDSAVSPALTAVPSLAEVPELAEPVRAAARLSRLVERVTEITSTRTSVTRGPGTPWADAEPLTALRSLVGAQEPVPARPLTDHLLDDLRPGSDPHLAAIAFHVAAPVVRSAAAELVTATEAAPPAEITVPILRHPVTLRPEGPDAGSLTAAEAAIRAEGASRGASGRWLAYVPALLPIVALVLAFTVSEMFAIAALLFGGLAGYVLWRRSAREADEARRVEAEVAELHRQADAAVWALHDYAREAAQREETAAESLTALTRLLRRGPAVAGQRS